MLTGDGRALRQNDAGAFLPVALQIPNISIKSRYVTASPDSAKLYIPAAIETGDYFADRVLVCDSKSLQLIATLPVNQQFFNLAVSINGRFLYAPTPNASVLVIDTMSPGSIQEITGIGATPVAVFVAP
jgi:DNA-binding beta-propeller fold protein YncE